MLGKRLNQGNLRGIIESLHGALVDGRSFSQALTDFPRSFPPLYINLVQAGEASGALPDILKRLVSHLMAVKTPARQRAAGAALSGHFEPGGRGVDYPFHYRARAAAHRVPCEDRRLAAVADAHAHQAERHCGRLLVAGCADGIGLFAFYKSSRARPRAARRGMPSA